MLQVPPVHEAVPLTLLHTVPHDPQLLVVVMLVSHPGEDVQSSYPVEQEMSQEPSTHEADPLTLLHTLPHVPQLLVVVVSVSHPAADVQSPKPVTQTMSQVPTSQMAVPLTLLHTVPHAPQWLVFVLVLVSQPLAWLLSQLPRPGRHDATWQVAELQAQFAFRPVHWVPHAPQLLVVERLVSHPSVSLLVLQSPQPASQAPVQDPLVHTAEGTWLVLQALLHPPQWAVVVRMFVSQPGTDVLQSAKPVAHPVDWQVPVEHDSPALGMSQGTPQPPQLVNVVRDVSQPSAGLLLQSPHPERQEPMPQTPVLQLPLAWAGAHTTPQPPQFDVVLVLVSHPSFAAVGLQSSKPLTQVGTHCPLAQASPWVFASEQAAPHCPQLATELRRSTSQPLAWSPSQLPQPALHSTTWHFRSFPTRAQVHVFTLGPLHFKPQDPQLSTVVMSVSQVAGLESQSARPAGQMSGRQIPAAQVGVAGAVTSHIVPHPPQL